MGSYYGWHGWGMGFSWLILLGIVIVAVYFFKDERHRSMSAKEILDKRYAKGEIDSDEYLERLKTLERSEKEEMKQEKGG